MKNLSGVLAVLALTLTGCSLQTGYYIHAEYKPVEYQADHSKAWNIANASGIHLDDHEVAEQQIKKNEGESVSDAYARSLALHGLGGFSWVSSIFLSEALAPTTMKDSANDTAIISFQPESRIKTVTDNAFPNKLSDQASRLASHDFYKAVDSALKELKQQFPNIKLNFIRNANISKFEKDSAYDVTYTFEDPEVDCFPDAETAKKPVTSCGVLGIFFQPANETTQQLPSFTGFTEKGFALVAESMKQDISASSKLTIRAFKKDTNIPNFQLPEKFVNKYVSAHEIARLISKYMPQGMYIYLPAYNEKIKGQEVKFPQMILDHGEVLYFVKPKK